MEKTQSWVRDNDNIEILYYDIPVLLALKTSNHTRYFVKIPLNFHYFVQVFNIFKLPHNHGMKWHAVFLSVSLRLFFGKTPETLFTLKHRIKKVFNSSVFLL